MGPTKNVLKFSMAIIWAMCTTLGLVSLFPLEASGMAGSGHVLITLIGGALFVFPLLQFLEPNGLVFSRAFIANLVFTFLSLGLMVTSFISMRNQMLSPVNPSLFHLSLFLVGIWSVVPQVLLIVLYAAIWFSGTDVIMTKPNK